MEEVEGAADNELAPPLSEPLTITPLFIPKRSLDVLQQPRLLSPSASGRLASQQ